METSTRYVTRTVRLVPLHYNQELPAEATEEAIVYVTPNIHRDLFLEVWLMFLSIYSLTLCLGQHMLLLNLHRQFSTLLVLELAHSTYLKLAFILILISVFCGWSWIRHLLSHIFSNVICVLSAVSPFLLFLYLLLIFISLIWLDLNLRFYRTTYKEDTFHVCAKKKTKTKETDSILHMTPKIKKAKQIILTLWLDLKPHSCPIEHCR